MTILAKPGASSRLKATELSLLRRPTAVVRTRWSKSGVTVEEEEENQSNPGTTELPGAGMDQHIKSLERKLQRPLLAKSRTLPSIPQSPTVSRVNSYVIGGSPPCRKSSPTETNHPKACTLPPAGELWRLEDDMEGDDEPGGCTEARPRSHSPFAHFAVRAAYLRKSVSADDHLDMGSDEGSGAAVEGDAGSKGKLKRKFSLGSADRKENQRKKLESGISKFTHRLSLKERPAKTEKTSSDRHPSYRRRSLSVDCCESGRQSRTFGHLGAGG
ncbi:hypothetical protein JOB18_037713 [Solea senegalensis]|uniref:Uncharacterized protein n=1 Tax=Solea senegalensis TaxID=28829 RepID=A0AAV6RUT9_SOLSE|nr:hypothetical protein JOB18_037713 [Solea senegalensis]